MTVYTACTCYNHYILPPIGAYARLFVHTTQEVKGPLPEELWMRLYEIFNLKTEVSILQGDWPKNFHVLDTCWVENKTIVFCKNEETVDHFTKMISEIKVILSVYIFKKLTPVQYEGIQMAHYIPYNRVI